MSDDRLTPLEASVGAALAATSGLAVLLYVFAGVPMSFTVPFVVLPATAALVLLALRRRGRAARSRAYAALLVRGAAAGLAATIAYDVVRPLLVRALGLAFDPYRAMPLFGTLITGRQLGDPIALAAGWGYHFWNGTSFGVMFALVRPQGGAVPGLAWGLGLQVLMMAAYPSFLQARLDDPAFMASGIVGHALWGVVLGVLIARWWRRGP